MTRRFIAAAILATSLGANAYADDAPKKLSAEHVQFFEKRIRPLLAARCTKCHGKKRQRGDLRLDNAKSIRLGGSSGPMTVVPGHPKKSLLIQAVLRQGDLKMPPKKSLSKREIADLTRWVLMGAPFPETTVAKVDPSKNHWAFQPIQRIAPPSVMMRSWPQTPVDRFILAELEKNGLSPAPRADRRTLIRRATFDLIGLPPTPSEIDAFLADDSPNAFAKVVDRLLASPHYGERWGRHWLDVARYADSNGLDENIAFGNAWRYRDYVVAAFNEDKPYDRFLLEQIAGDLLPTKDPAARRTNLVATGFLALGPKVLAEVDEKKMEMDILDEQIDTLGKSVMGLTLGCARCHHHKFDPITMQDYYGLTGIFQSTKTMEHFKKIARWHENDIATDADRKAQKKHDARVSDLTNKINAILNEQKKQLLVRLKNKKLPKKFESLFPKPSQDELKKLRTLQANLKKTGPTLPTAMGVAEQKPVDAKLLKRGDHLKPVTTVPRGFIAHLTKGKPQIVNRKKSGRLELARWLIRSNHPLTSRVFVNRVWRWHFGRGIVATTDNFGRLGRQPDNQPLLDWLAHDFMKNNWSIKKLHRTIMLSSVYQMSDAFRAKAAAVDAENRLYWRWKIRRLEAETIRDSLLAVSGRLNRTMGGSLLHVANRKFLFDHTSKDTTRYDAPRRTLYLPVIRNNLYDVLQLFDATDATVSSGHRASTTVATQALFVLNSELVADATENLARQLLNHKEMNDAERLVILYRKAYGRRPTKREVNRMRAALVEFADESKLSTPVMRKRQAWTWVCHVVLAANEFMYVR